MLRDHLRCNDVLQINADSSENENVARDASYAQFDQWRVIINPNGNTARECSFLDDLTSRHYIRMPSLMKMRVKSGKIFMTT